MILVFGSYWILPSPRIQSKGQRRLERFCTDSSEISLLVPIGCFIGHASSYSLVLLPREASSGVSEGSLHHS